LFSGPLFFSRVAWQFRATWAVCAAPATRVRVQVFARAARGGAAATPTRLYQAVLGEADVFGGNPRRLVEVRDAVDTFRLIRGCQPRSVYAEACVVDGVTREPTCARTEVVTVDALPPPQLRAEEPVPPAALALAPGDSVRLRTNVTVGADESQSATPVGPPAVRLVAVVRRADNTTRRSAAVLGGPTTIVNELLADVTAADDGAVAFVEVSRAACAATGPSVASTEGALGGSTAVTVSAATPPLVTQDAALPTIDSVVSPPTALGEPVTLTVAATNGGGGRRRVDGALVPTALTYQWLRQSRAFTAGAPVGTPPDVLPGETGPTLNLPAAECLNLPLSCGRFGCSGLPQYRVNVCNTAGCARSAVVRPAILRPSDETLAAELEASGRCEFAD